MTELEELIERGIVRFACVGLSTNTHGKRHASLSLDSRGGFAQGYGATCEDAVRAAAANIGTVEKGEPKKSDAEPDLYDLLG